MGSKRKRGAKNSSHDSQVSNKRAKNDHQDAQAIPTGTKLDLDKSSFTEKPTTDDRKREARIYELLGSADANDRIAAADALITGLLASEEPVLLRHLEKRLFRGLASSRNASRVGFSLVLAEILSQLFGSRSLAKSKYPGLTFEKVLDILADKTESGGNIPGQEERDFCFGQLFGLQCFVESKVLFDDADTSRWPKVLDMLLKLANKKVWLRSQCAWVIVETLPQMGQDKACQTLKQLLDIGLGKTAEGVGIWLKMISCYPDMKMPAKPWTNPLAPKSLPELANVLKENVKQDEGNKNTPMAVKQGNWNAQLHFVWDLILAYYTEKVGTAGNDEHFKLFWNTVIDDGLFSKNASDGQKFRGFMIFQKLFQGLAPKKEKSLIKELFSRNLMKCLMNQASKEDRYLHRAALKSLKVIETIVEAEPTYLVLVLKELLGPRGAFEFDMRTNTKTVEKLLQFATSDNTTTLLKMFRDPVVAMKEGDVSEVEKLRQVYAEYVFRLSTQASSSADDSSAGPSGSKLAIREMATRAYSKSNEFSPELSQKTRDAFRTKLASAFAKLAKRREEYRFLCEAIAAVEPSAVNMSAEMETQRDAALKALRKLLKSGKKRSVGDTDSSLGLALLYAVTILQLYDGDSDAINTLEDLNQCSEKMKEDDSAVSVLLVEILLSLASRPSTLTRQVTMQVFEAFTGQFSAEALEGLTEPLVAEENMKGQQALFDAEDEDMVDADASDESDEDDGDGEDEVSEIGSDVEFVTLNGAEPMNEDDEDDDSDDGSERNDAHAQELANLDDALAKVLNSHRLDQDNDAGDSDNESEMTDSEMMALDEKLVEVFKQRAKKANKKKENKDAKDTVINFKHRILDFLDVFVKKETFNPLAFRLLLPLLELIRTTQTKELANKATKIVSSFNETFKKARKSGTKISIDVKSQLELLREILGEASKDFSHAYASAVSASSLLVASSLFAADKSTVSQINSLYAELQTKRISLGAKVQPSILLDWLNWGNSHASNVSKS